MQETQHPAFSVTVDVVALTIREGALCGLVVRRGAEPFAGRWALPGGFVHLQEDLLAAARRELVEETGVPLEPAALEQVATYGVPDRDPRGRTVSVAYLAVIPQAPDAVAGSDAAAARWHPVDELLAPDDGAEATEPALAFDHGRILRDGVERCRAKLEYTNLACAFVPAEFTVSELRAVYDAIWGSRLDAGNFHRKVAGTEGFVEPTGSTRQGEAGRPARVFRAGPADALNPPLTRRSVRASSAPAGPRTPRSGPVAGPRTPRPA